MRNAAGLVIIAVGAIVLIVGIRGTQSTILPQLFKKQSSSTTTGNTTYIGGSSITIGGSQSIGSYV